MGLFTLWSTPFAKDQMGSIGIESEGLYFLKFQSGMETYTQPGNLYDKMMMSRRLDFI